MKKVINVTAKDIKTGTQGDFCTCPIAKAALRAFKYLAPITVVVGEYISVYEPEGYEKLRGKLPEVAVVFRDKFDKAAVKCGKPFRFTIDMQP